MHDNIPAVGRGVRRSYEELMDLKRSMQFLGVARVDDHEAISQRLAEDAIKKVSSFVFTVLHFKKMTEVRPGKLEVKSISSVKAPRWKVSSSVQIATALGI